MTERGPHYCGAPTSAETQRYDKSGHCKRRVRQEGELCPFHARLQFSQASMPADRHE